MCAVSGRGSEGGRTLDLVVAGPAGCLAPGLAGGCCPRPRASRGGGAAGGGGPLGLTTSRCICRIRCCLYCCCCRNCRIRSSSRLLGTLRPGCMPRPGRGAAGLGAGAGAGRSVEHTTPVASRCRDPTPATKVNSAADFLAAPNLPGRNIAWPPRTPQKCRAVLRPRGHRAHWVPKRKILQNRWRWSPFGGVQPPTSKKGRRQLLITVINCVPVRALGSSGWFSGAPPGGQGRPSSHFL